MPTSAARVRSKPDRETPIDVRVKDLIVAVRRTIDESQAIQQQSRDLISRIGAQFAKRNSR
jgi:hypothetical protein